MISYLLWLYTCKSQINTLSRFLNTHIETIIIDLPFCQTIHKIDLTFMVTLIVNQMCTLQSFGSLLMTCQTIPHWQTFYLVWQMYDDRTDCHCTRRLICQWLMLLSYIGDWIPEQDDDNGCLKLCYMWYCILRDLNFTDIMD